MTATGYKSVGQPFYELSNSLVTFLSVVATPIHDFESSGQETTLTQIFLAWL